MAGVTREEFVELQARVAKTEDALGFPVYVPTRRKVAAVPAARVPSPSKVVVPQARRAPSPSTATTSSTVVGPPPTKTLGVMLEDETIPVFASVLADLNRVYRPAGWSVQVVSSALQIRRTTAHFVLYMMYDNTFLRHGREDYAEKTTHKKVEAFKRELAPCYIIQKGLVKWSGSPADDVLEVEKDGTLVVDDLTLRKLTVWTMDSLVDPRTVSILPGLADVAAGGGGGTPTGPGGPQPDADLPYVGVVIDNDTSLGQAFVFKQLNVICERSGLPLMRQIKHPDELKAMKGDIVLYLYSDKRHLVPGVQWNTAKLDDVVEYGNVYGKVVIKVPVLSMHIDPNLETRTLNSMIIDTNDGFVVDRRTLGLVSGWSEGKGRFLDPTSQRLPIRMQQAYPDAQ